MRSPQTNVLVVVPTSPALSSGIVDKMMSHLAALRANVFIDYRPAGACEKKTPWSKVAVVRNQILDDGLWRHFSHMLWIDADVVKFPPTIIEDLLAANSLGVAAPVDIIEGTQTFHDWAAFIYQGRDHIYPECRDNLPGRNIRIEPPYFPTREAVTLMDCVGTVTLVNTEIYASGARYEDHPAFTDHYPICKAARDMGRGVCVARNCIVEHANLPWYGEKWK